MKLGLRALFYRSTISTAIFWYLASSALVNVALHVREGRLGTQGRAVPDFLRVRSRKKNWPKKQ